jgi:GNAT superfamily N-acetyltransferase
MQQASALADAVDRSFVDAWQRLADREHGVRASFGSVEVAATGLPVSFFNPIFVRRPLERSGDLGEAVSALRGAGLPFVVHMRRDLGDTVRTAAEALHLRQVGVLPGMALRLPVEIPSPLPELEIERVVDAASYEAFIGVGAEGFEMPAELVADVLPAGLFRDDGVRGYVATVDREAVATSVAIQLDRALGIFNVATRPARRRAGFGTAVSWHAIEHADPGTSAALLQSTEMGRGVYERMGFRTVVEYVEYESS